VCVIIGNFKDTGAPSTGSGTLSIVGKEVWSTVGVDKIGAGDVAGMETTNCDNSWRLQHSGS